MGKKVLIEIELGQFQFQCDSCKKIIDKSTYCIAQQAMGHDLSFTCDCKHITEFKGI